MMMYMISQSRKMKQTDECLIDIRSFTAKDRPKNLGRTRKEDGRT